MADNKPKCYPKQGKDFIAAHKGTGVYTTQSDRIERHATAKSNPGGCDGKLVGKGKS